MSKTILIAKRELYAFKSTWMGYIIAAAALLLNGLLFNSYAIGSAPKFSADVLSDYFFFASGISMVAGLFLAMRLISEEKETGTIILFNTSPVSERELIYGKFFSAFFFLLILHGLSLYMPALIFVNGKVSLGHIASGYLMLSLIGAAAISISLFASAISPNQLLSGVLGALFLVIFLVFWMLSDVVDEPFKDLFSYLSIHNMHYRSFARGIVHLRDVIYYLSVIVFFLECSVRVMEGRRWRG